MPHRTAHPALIGFISTGRVKRICRAAMGRYAIRRTRLVVRAKRKGPPTEADASINPAQLARLVVSGLRRSKHKLAVGGLRAML